MKNESVFSSRRNFLKTSAAGVGVLAAGNYPLSQVFAGSKAWVPGMPCNPWIPDTRVVYVTDKSMITAVPKFSGTDAWLDQNSKLDFQKIYANMDKMACHLAGEANPKDAWGKIFWKPSGKTWEQVTVFFKMCSADAHNQPHIPIVIKVCEELIRLGVKPENIKIADPSRNAHTSTSYSAGSRKYDYYEGGGVNKLPAGVVVHDEQYPNLMGYQRTMGKTHCFTWKDNSYGPAGNTGIDVYVTKLLAEKVGGVVTYPSDIIVNIASNKGHSGKEWMGGATLCTKNHVGSFANHINGKPFATDKSNPEYCPGQPFGSSAPGTPLLIEYASRHEVIMGGGTAEYPTRQQLCIVDSLWATMSDAHAVFDKNLNTLVMGTNSPWVDYLTVTEIRKKIMNRTDYLWVFEGYLKQMGYSDPKAGKWVDALQPVSARDNPSVASKNSNFSVFTLLLTGKAKGRPVQFQLAGIATNESTVQIFDINGTLVRNLGKIKAASTQWDCRNKSGSKVPPGRYIVKLQSGNRTYAKTITL